MPRIKSAIKRVNQTKSKTMRNKIVKTQVATAMKKFKVAINNNDPVTAEKLLPLAFSEIDSACAKNILHKNNAARKKSSLAKTLSDLKSGKLVIAAKVDNKTKIAEKRAKEAAVKAAQKKTSEENRTKRQAEKEAAASAKPVKKPAKKDDKKVEEPVKAAKPEKKAEAKPKAAAKAEAAPKAEKAAAEPKAEKAAATEAKPKAAKAPAKKKEEPKA